MTTRLGRVAGCLALALASARCADKIMAPVANAGTAVTVNIGSSVALDGRSSADPQGRPLAYDWSIAVRPVLSQTSLNDAHIATPSFIPDLDGAYTIELVVSNGVLSSPRSQVTVTARKCSQAAPEITAAAAAPANPNTGTSVQLSATIHDADNDPACNLNQTFTLLWTAVARPGASAAALSDPAATSPTFVPDQIGTYQFSVVATDSTGLHSAPKFVTFKTTTCGSATPSITSATASPSAPNPGDTVSLVAVATDADNLAGCSLGQTLRFDWRVAGQPAGSSATLSDPTVSNPSITPDAIGTYVFVVTATDSTGKVSDPVAVKFTTTACGSAVPTITSATASPSSPNIGTAVLLSATAADADNGPTCHRGQTLTLHWALVSRPATSSAFLDNPASASPSFTPDAVGTYQFSVTVSDGTGNTSPPTFVGVVVASCGAAAVTFAAPAITAAFAEAAANVGAAVTLTAHPIDPAVACGVPAGPVQYVWKLAGPSGSSAVAFAVQAGTQFTFTPDVVGTYDVSVKAVDARGQSATASTSVSTTTCGAAPIAVQVTPATSTVNSYQTQTLTATPAATGCPARFAPQIAWAVAGVGAPAQLSGSFGGTVDFRGTGPGDYTVSAAAINTSGHEGPVGTASVHVNVCGSRPPVVVTTSNSPTFPARRQTVTLAATAVDPDASCGAAQPSTIAFELLSLPQGSALSFPAGAVSFQADVEGTYAFRVVATESGTGLRSDAAVLNVTVLDPDPAASSVTAVATGGSGFVVADGVDSATVTVTLRNRLGQPVAALPVSMAASGSANAFSPATGNSNVNGVFVTTVTSTKAETKTFTATANPLLAPVVLNDHPSVTFIAGPATHFSVAVSTSPITAGVADSFTATALDQFNNVATGYIGTADFSSSDPAAELTPPNHTFTSGTGLNNGVFTASVKFHAAGSQTVTAADHANASITGTSGAVTVAPGAATRFSVVVSTSPVTAGVADAFTVTARDQFNNVATGYVGTADFSSSDPAAELTPPNHTFTSGTGLNNGVFTASVKFHAAGSQTVTAADHANASITGTAATVTVNAAAPATASFTVQPGTTTTNAPISPAVQVTVKDAFTNLVPGVSVTVSIGTNPTGGVLSGTLVRTTNTSGVATFADLSINKAGNGYTLAATVTSTPANVVVGSNAFNLVNPAVITTFIAAPTSIFGGGATQLSFVFTGGTGSINPGAVSVPTSGSTVVTNVAATTTFTLNVTNAAGTVTSATATATVTTATGWVNLNNAAPISPDTRAAQPFSLTFDPANSSRLYAATLTNGVLTTASGGQTWTGTGFPAGVPVHRVSVGHPGGSDSLWASVNCAGKLFHSTNGSSWSEVDGTVNGLPVVACPIGRTAILLDPSDPQQRTLYVTFSQGGLFRSTDDGATWLKVPLPLTAPALDDQPTALGIASNGTVFVGTAPGNVFRVSGTTATLLTPTALGSQVNAIAVNPDGTTVVAGRADGVVKFATSPGFAFNPGVTLTGSVAGLTFAVDGFSSGGVITGSTYAVTATGTASGGAVFRSTNFGATFTNVTATTPAIEASDYFFVAPHPTDGTTVYVLGNGSLSTPTVTIPSSGFFKRTLGAP